MTSLKGVCVVSPGGWNRQGGIESHARSIATSLRTEQPGVFTEILDSRGDRHLAFAPLYLFWACLRLVGFRLRNRINVVHVQVSERGSFVRKAVVVWLAKRLGLHVVLHHHGAEAIETYATASPRIRKLVHFQTHAADMNVVLGTAWATWLTDELGVPNSRVEIVYNGIPDQPDDPAPVIKDGIFKPVLLAVLSDRKGVGDFLKALAKLKDQGIKFDATIGGGGPHLPRFKKMAEELGIGASCTFPGWIAPGNVPATLAAHDCYVLPSYKEGLPIGILEALRAARAVVTTDVGSISEAIPANSGVTILTPGDIDALADTLAKLATDRANLEREGDAARSLFLQKFTLDIHLKRLLAIYRQITASRTEMAATRSVSTGSN